MDYTLHEWVRMASHHGSIARCAIEKQAEESGLDALAVREKMRHHLRVMQEAAQQGLDERLRSVTGLTGGQAALMMKRLQAGKCLAGNLLGKAEVYALATAECNGCMGKIVAAPTAGACGILPGAVLAMMEEKGATEEQAVDALFVAAAVVRRLQRRRASLARRAAVRRNAARRRQWRRRRWCIWRAAIRSSARTRRRLR